jgi:hypothetical protein
VTDSKRTLSVSNGNCQGEVSPLHDEKGYLLESLVVFTSNVFLFYIFLLFITCAFDRSLMLCFHKVKWRDVVISSPFDILDALSW